MSEANAKKVKPDIRAITRLVPPSGNLVQGQSELPIDPQLAAEAAAIIAASQNHYGGSEGDANLRKAVAEKIAKYNGIEVDVDASPYRVDDNERRHRGLDLHRPELSAWQVGSGF